MLEARRTSPAELIDTSEVLEMMRSSSANMSMLSISTMMLSSTLTDRSVVAATWNCAVSTSTESPTLKVRASPPSKVTPWRLVEVASKSSTSIEIESASRLCSKASREMVEVAQVMLLSESKSMSFSELPALELMLTRSVVIVSCVSATAVRSTARCRVSSPEVMVTTLLAWMDWSSSAWKFRFPESRVKPSKALMERSLVVTSPMTMSRPESTTTASEAELSPVVVSMRTSEEMPTAVSETSSAAQRLMESP
mmetsp:Transcript_10552/g.43046  ORF Transcript_10552/g.43046 Transcript_10552/m.43046 type:complete len:253 (-) Transcript_10552:983-1741(-)